MSVPVLVLRAEALLADGARRRPVVRRRALLCVATVLFVTGLAAVPLPLRDEHRRLQGEVEQLERVVATLRSDQADFETRERALAFDPAELATRAVHWLGGADPMSLRNQLVAVAQGCGLAMQNVSVSEGVLPLGEGAPIGSRRVVLGSFDDTDDSDFGMDEQPQGPPLSATRFSIEGTGPLSGVLLFAGLLRELPQPLRLQSLDLRLVAGGARFVLVTDRLSCPLRSDPPDREYPGDA